MDLLVFRNPVSTWTHLVWFVLSVPAAYVLWQRCRGDRPRQLSMLVFGVGLAACFGGSALYHAVPATMPHFERFALIDYSAIYLLIAGTGTPIIFTLLRGRWRWCPLALVWSMAVLGIGARLSLDEFPRWLSTLLYLGMGWGMASTFPELMRVMQPRPLLLVPLGGVFYSAGAAFYLARWPTLWPGVFSSHELLHLCVMAGSLSHFWFVLHYVVPFEREESVVEAPVEELLLEPALAGEESSC